jgi:carboxymethylenebutenolidase
MTQLQRYLAEEIAEDHADGQVTRREAVRRLGLLGATFSQANHAFFNDTGANFNAPAAEEAYRRTFAGYEKHLAECRGSRH